MSKNKKTTLVISSDLRDSLKAISIESGVKIEQLTAEAIKSFISKNPHLQETK